MDWWQLSLVIALYLGLGWRFGVVLAARGSYAKRIKLFESGYFGQYRTRRWRGAMNERKDAILAKLGWMPVRPVYFIWRLGTRDFYKVIPLTEYEIKERAETAEKQAAERRERLEREAREAERETERVIRALDAEIRKIQAEKRLQELKETS